MKKWFAAAFFTLLLACTFGCSSPKLADGKYATTIPGREDCAYVYGDYIFLWMKDLRNESGTTYCFWGGKFEADGTFRLIFDMDRETKKEWDFYYNFFMQSGGIAVADLSHNQGFDLKPVSTDPSQRSAGMRPLDGVNGQPAPAYR